MIERLKAWCAWWADRSCSQCGSLWHLASDHCQEHGQLMNGPFGCDACFYQELQAREAYEQRRVAELKRQEQNELATLIAKKVAEKLNQRTEKG